MTRDYSSELTAYIDGEVSAELRAEIEAQLQRDPSLASAERRLRKTIELMKAVPESAPSATLKSAVMRQLDSGASVSRLPVWWSARALVPMGAIAAAALVGIVVLQQPVQPQGATSVQEEELLVAQQMDEVEDLELVGIESADDLDVIEQLNELEVQR